MPELDRDAAQVYRDALRAMEAADTEKAFLAAADAFASVRGWADADARAEACRSRAEDCRRDGVYSAAAWQMRRKSVSGYLSAAQLFDAIPGWRDADAQAARCRAEIERMRARREKARRAARKRMRALRWAAAILIPAALAAGILWAKVVAPRRQYARAAALLDAGEYAQAWELLEGLDLRDSAARRAEIQAMLLAEADVGRPVIFGHYEQDGDAADGAEGILWRVLARDGDRFLLLSEYGLDARPYQDPGANVSWAESQLRDWLNGAFFDAAFSADEQAQILPAAVRADPNPAFPAPAGDDAEDLVFLLSALEVYRYFPTAAERQCSPTAFAAERPAFVSKENGRTWWWLRTPGLVSNYAVCVTDSGALMESGFYVSYAFNTVRPAMWVRLGSGAD